MNNYCQILVVKKNYFKNDINYLTPMKIGEGVTTLLRRKRSFSSFQVSLKPGQKHKQTDGLLNSIYYNILKLSQIQNTELCVWVIFCLSNLSNITKLSSMYSMIRMFNFYIVYRKMINQQNETHPVQINKNKYPTCWCTNIKINSYWVSIYNFYKIWTKTWGRKLTRGESLVYSNFSFTATIKQVFRGGLL